MEEVVGLHGGDGGGGAGQGGGGGGAADGGVEALRLAASPAV